MSIVSDLAAQVIKAGAPILGGIIGGPAGSIATAAVSAIAGALGSDDAPDAVSAAIKADPDKAAAALRQVEQAAPAAWIALQKANLDTYAETMRAEFARGWFYSAWRPAGMWLVLGCWAFALLPAPWLRIAVPMPDLVSFTGLYLTLYMGGHTAKEWFSAHYGAPKGR
jgi:hypothetical protein